jgi:hypothetical protein
MKNRLALQRIYWIKPKVPIVEEIKDIDVALNLQEDYLAETPSGKGQMTLSSILSAENGCAYKKRFVMMPLRVLWISQFLIVPYLIPRP